MGEGNKNTAIDELVKTKQLVKRKAPVKRARKQLNKKSIERTAIIEEEAAQQVKVIEKDGEFKYLPTITRQKKRPKRPIV